MAVSLINPDGHVQVPLCHHVAVTAGSKHIHLAGQVARDGDETLLRLVISPVRSRRYTATSRGRSPPRWMP